MRWMLAFLTAGLACAQISNVSVLGSTNVQSLISYQSPVDSTCSVEVSERPDFNPLVNDVNPALFPNSDSDGRPGSSSDGRSRVIAIGKRAVEQGADGKWYSRALQTDTVHYYRIRCGDSTTTGSFRTANIPVGVTYPWPIPQDPKTGNFRWPTIDNNDRNQTIIDPNYGTLIRRITLAGDAPEPDIRYVKKQFASAGGANWANPSAVLSDDGSAATYSASGQDWLALTNPNFGLTPYYTFNNSIGPLIVTVKGSAQGDSADSRAIDACLTVDGASCRGGILTTSLDTSESVKTLGDSWGEGIYSDELTPKTFGVMIRAHNPGTALTIQYVEIELNLNQMADMPNAGFMRQCAPVKSNGGFHCAFPTGNGNLMYWINPDSGEVRFLGVINARNWGGNNALCQTQFAMWDFTDPNAYYCSTKLDGNIVLLKGTYTGNDAPANSGAIAQFNWTNLTPPGNTITDLITKFRPDFDPKQFPCGLGFLTNQYAVFQCWMGDQNSIAWLAVFDIGNGQPVGSGGTGRIIAAAKSFASPNTRWCGLHSPEYLGDVNWIGWSGVSLDGNRGGPGQGPYTVTLKSAMPALTGRMTINVSGEPDSPPGQAPLMPAAEGDVFRLKTGNGWDFVRIVRKNSPTSWDVDRKVVQTTAQAHSPGETMAAYCNATNFDDPTQGPSAYWNFLQDPQAQDTTKTGWLNETQLTGGHIVERGNYRIMAHWQGYQIVTPGVPKSFNTPPNYKVVSNPKWAGARAYVGLPDKEDGLANTYQQHLSYENYRASGRDNWFVDFIPFIGDVSLTSSISAVPGFSQVYKAAAKQLNADAMPTFGICGGRQLKNVSPGPIRDQDTYSYCMGSGCVSGASASDVYISCPAPVSPANSSCRYDAGGNDQTVCVGSLAPYGQTVTQFFLDNTGMRNRALTNALMPWHSPRTRLSLETAYALPDGSWVVFPGYGNNARRDLFMVKVPAQPPFDPNPLTGSQPLTTSVDIAPPADASQVVLNYGGTSDLANATSPQDCSGKCSVTVSTRPLELLFAKPVFRNSAGQKVGEGALKPKVVTGTAGSGLGKPVFSAAGVVNSASYEAKLAPGSMVSVFGQNLATCSAQADGLPLPKSLCGASITFNGQNGLLRSTTLNQLDVVLPSSVGPSKALDTVVVRESDQSDMVQVPGSTVSMVAPAIYFYTLDDQVRRAVAVNPDNTINGPDRPELNLKPLRPGDNALLYANGLGATNPPVADGEAAPSNPPAATAASIKLFINGTSEPVQFAGLAPGFTGVYQVNFTVDPNTPVNDNGDNQIWLTVDDVESPRIQITLAK